MKPEIELLEKYGLTRDEDSLAVEEFNAKRFSRLHEELYSGMYKRQLERRPEQDTSQIDPFSFMASASLRADSTCGHPPCRTAKLDFLGRYTALYANQVILPLWLSSPNEAAKAPATARYELARSVQSLLHLRPLIESDLIVPVVMRSYHCKHTTQWANRMMNAVRDAARAVARDSSSMFHAVYQLPEYSPTGKSTVYIEGPKDLIEHGEMVGTWNESDKWRRKSWRYDGDGTVEISGSRKLAHIYNLVFEKIASDTTFFLAFARFHSARYLSDLPGETFLLDALTKDDEVAASNRRMHECLTHLVPLLGDLPVETLLRIRREERDCFIRYRLAIQQLLNQIVMTKKRINKRDVQDLYREKVEPELYRMKSELKQERRRQTRRILGGTAGLAASVAFGAFGGFLPLLAKGALVGASAMVGGRLFSRAAEATCEHGASLREKNDFYFLLRAAQEGE